MGLPLTLSGPVVVFLLSSKATSVVLQVFHPPLSLAASVNSSGLHWTELGGSFLLDPTTWVPTDRFGVSPTSDTEVG